MMRSMAAPRAGHRFAGVCDPFLDTDQSMLGKVQVVKDVVGKGGGFKIGKTEAVEE